MANYKAPRHVRVVGSLPVNASGKVVKYQLRREAAQGGDAR
jgi:HIP---CoA ligase